MIPTPLILPPKMEKLDLKFREIEKQETQKVFRVCPVNRRFLTKFIHLTILIVILIFMAKKMPKPKQEGFRSIMRIWTSLKLRRKDHSQLRRKLSKLRLLSLMPLLDGSLILPSPHTMVSQHSMLMVKVMLIQLLRTQSSSLITSME
jgi:hypothetical protein